ncbi:UDP-glucose 4-epimerase GalE [Leadbettera azotonutricia]|uniref:UDP-glucose 4-epimerase n=1 Tax=Leadbettera azotonutricia (strain ATCC BAA-888 / DSM 13862 / ZAS-9) TaxID=545695 RepID=F5YF99_LEAAZ|nr:UDP-glucose 4-epimerase GalE [Leadbettera azotonutricia]AEF80094.1 UDP-glucose 4-epimerase [Leadbettera azotonutricia ZAS-9]
MNILIIGGAGYIGSHVAREFLDQGHEVTVFDNLSSGLRENLFPEAKFIHGTILDYTSLVRACAGSQDIAVGGLTGKKFDAVVYLAAFKAAGESMLKPEKYSTNNISGAINILNAMAETGIKNIVFSSSAAIYGEPEYLPIDEKHPARPENYYGFTKLEIERIMGWYDKLKGIHSACLRYFNAAGYDVKGRINGLEQNPANLIPVVMEAACGMRKELQIFGDDYDTPDGTCIRDYVHVSDLAIGHVAALDYISKNSKSIAVNLGSEKGTSVKEIVEAARRISGKPLAVKIAVRRPGDPAKLTASSKLAHEALSWTAQYSDIDSIIKTTWKVYNNQNER